MLPGLIRYPGLIAAHCQRAHTQKHRKEHANQGRHHHVSCSTLSLHLPAQPSPGFRILQFVIQVGQSVGEEHVRYAFLAGVTDGAEFETQDVRVERAFVYQGTEQSFRLWVREWEQDDLEGIQGLK